MFYLHGFMGSQEDFDFFPDSYIGLEYINAEVSAQSWEQVSTHVWNQISDEKISLFGYSMGGRIALAMFAAHPDRVEKLVLCGAQFCPPLNPKTLLPRPSGGQEGERIPEHLLKYARELRAGQTDAEKLIWHFLRKKNLADSKFRRQHPIGNYIVDFYCHAKKLVVELDGSQHLKENEKAYDENRTRFLNEQKIKVLRFDNVQVLTQTIPVLESIFSALTSSDNELPLPLGEGWGGGDQMRQVDQKDSEIGKVKTKDLAGELASPTLTLPQRERGQEGVEYVPRKIIDQERATFLQNDYEAFLNWWSTLELFGPQKTPTWSLVRERRLARMKNLAPAWAELLQVLSVSEQPDFSQTLKTHPEKIVFVFGENDEKYKAFAENYRDFGIQTISVPNAWHAVHLDNPKGLLSALARLK